MPEAVLVSLELQTLPASFRDHIGLCGVALLGILVPPKDDADRMSADWCGDVECIARCARNMARWREAHVSLEGKCASLGVRSRAAVVNVSI